MLSAQNVSNVSSRLSWGYVVKRLENQVHSEADVGNEFKISSKYGQNINIGSSTIVVKRAILDRCCEIRRQPVRMEVANQKGRSTL